MAKSLRKQDFPVGRAHQYLEPGPIVLAPSQWRGKNNIMTLGWHTILEFTPSLVGCMISGGNHSHDMIRRSGEGVINLPTTALTNAVVGVGNTSGSKVDLALVVLCEAQHLEVPPQDSWHGLLQQSIDDGMAFSPWHGLAAHQPLGSIMRARRHAYPASAKFRLGKNGCPFAEPKGF
jgi:Flavin reductase like domain